MVASLLSAPPASAINCTLPGESQPVRDTIITTEALQSPFARTAIGRTGLPGVPLGPMYAVLADGTIARIAANWAGPKRVLAMVGKSNDLATFDALMRRLVIGLDGIPPIQSDVAGLNLAASKNGVLGWGDPDSGYWQTAQKKWKNLKIGSPTQVLFVTELPEVRGVIYGPSGSPVTAENVQAMIALARTMFPQSHATVMELPFLGWRTGNPLTALYDETRAHADHLLLQSMAENGAIADLDHFANHAHPRVCTTDYLSDGIHSTPLGYDRIAAELVQWLWTNPAYQWLWQPAVTP